MGYIIDKRLVKFIERGKGYVAILAGSGSDDKAKGEKPSHIEQIVNSVMGFGIPFGVHIASAHKQGPELLEVLAEYDNLNHPIMTYSPT